MGSNEDTVVCCGLFLLGIAVISVLKWLYDNWGGISQWIPTAIYALSVIITIFVIIYELKNIWDNKPYTSLFTLLFAGILIVIVIASINPVMHVQPPGYPVPAMTPYPTIAPTYTYSSNLPTTTVPSSSYNTAKPVATTIQGTPSSSGNVNNGLSFQYTVTNPKIADPITIYTKPIPINSIRDLAVGDIVQEKTTDSAYFVNKAKYIKQIDSANDKVVIQDVIRDTSSSTFYLLGDPDSLTSSSKALVNVIRYYPNKIGHAQGALPSKVFGSAGEGGRGWEWDVYPYGS